MGTGEDLSEGAEPIRLRTPLPPSVRLTVTYRAGTFGTLTVPGPESVEIVWEAGLPDTTALERLIFALRSAPGYEAEVEIQGATLRAVPDAPDWEL